MFPRFAAVRSKSSIWMKLLLMIVVLFTALPLVLVAETLYGAANMRYQVTGEGLQIPYAWRQTWVRLGAIQSVQVISPTRLTRLSGNNTPGLYSGRWSSAETGPLDLYATRLDSLVIVKTEFGTLGLTPADPAGFVAALKGGPAGEFAPATPSGNPLWVLLPLFGLVLVIVPGFWYLVRLLDRFPKVLTYELGPKALVIETGWRPVRVPYTEIDSAEETTLKGWPVRVMGSELKGVHWGTFTWSAVPGRRINLYATQLKPIVLVRAGKRSFGLSPADAEGFVGALRERLPRD